MPHPDSRAALLRYSRVIAQVLTDLLHSAELRSWAVAILNALVLAAAAVSHWTYRKGMDGGAAGAVPPAQPAV